MKLTRLEKANDRKSIPLSRSSVEVFCQSADLIAVIEAIRKAAYTGHPGDGKIFAGPVDVACRIRSGETGVSSLMPSTEL